MPDKVTEVNHDVRTDVNGSVGTLGKLKAGQVGAKVDVEAKNLFEKYPNTDRILIAQMMSATYCDMIRDSKTLKDSERLRLWSEFSDRIFKYENPTTNPPSPKSPHKGAADKGPITVNNSPGTAVSVGQKGGITAGVVNIGVLERNLTDKQAEVFADFYEHLPEEFRLELYAAQGDESSRFMALIRGALNLRRKTLIPWSQSLMLDSRQHKGLFVYTHPGQSASIRQLCADLLSAQLHVDCYEESSEPRNSITIYVGESENENTTAAAPTFNQNISGSNNVGIQAEQINIGVNGRLLSNERYTTFVTRLRALEKGTAYLIIHEPITKEMNAFGGQLQSAFRDAGWNLPAATRDISSDSRLVVTNSEVAHNTPDGLHCVPDGSALSSQIMEALTNVGIQCSSSIAAVYPTPIPQPTITLFLGRSLEY
jgi:hypothetical protein